MSKLLKYELRRMIGNQFFYCMAAVLLGYGWLLLSKDVIRGISNTAPFSEWSMGYYISHLAPIICLGELVMLLFYVSKQECMVQTIAFPTSFKKTTFLVMRSCVILLAILILSIVVIGLGLGFCGIVFSLLVLKQCIMPFVVTVVPLVVFVLGAGVFLSKRNPLFLLGLAIFLGIGFMPWLDLYGIHFYVDYPIQLEVLDPKFSIPVTLLVKQLILTGTGILFYMAEWMNRRKQE